jgi:hypothetical protein
LAKIFGGLVTVELNRGNGCAKFFEGFHASLSSDFDWSNPVVAEF